MGRGRGGGEWKGLCTHTLATSDRATGSLPGAISDKPQAACLAQQRCVHLHVSTLPFAHVPSAELWGLRMTPSNQSIRQPGIRCTHFLERAARASNMLGNPHRGAHIQKCAHTHTSTRPRMSAHVYAHARTHISLMDYYGTKGMGNLDKGLAMSASTPPNCFPLTLTCTPKSHLFFLTHEHIYMHTRSSHAHTHIH